jgi:thiol-disulfide isomerase/thioredoxin
MVRRGVIAAWSCAVLALAGCTGHDAVSQSGVGRYQFKSATKIGELIPQSQRKSGGDISGPGLTTGQVALSDFANKVVVLNYWASWCPPCRTEMPSFESVYTEADQTKVSFLGVDTKDNRPAGQSFVADQQITYPMIYDEAGKTLLKLGHVPATTLPFTILLDSKHHVAAVYLSALQPADLTPVLHTLVTED